MTLLRYRPAWRRESVLRLLASVDYPLTTAAVSRALVCAHETATTTLHDAKRLGLVQPVDGSVRRWTLTDAGRDAAAALPPPEASR